MDDTPVQLSHLGEAALLLQSPGPMSLHVQRRYWAFEKRCRTLPQVIETVLGVHSLLLRLHPEIDPTRFGETLRGMWSNIRPEATASRSRLVDVPVVYGGAMGEDLQPLAAQHGLSVDELVQRHTAAEYTVYALGSQPGFAYLGGLDPRLATPRRDTPRLKVVTGSVVIGGAQAGVISRTSPSGWHIIGHTELPFFDPKGDPPALLAPGDRLRFIIRDVHS